jgi:hypothetical protein
VLAVIGSGEAFGEKFDKAVLCEIGLSRSRPYNEAKGLGGKAGELNIPPRKKCFYLSREQYIAVAPTIFRCLQKLTNERVLRWQTGPHNNNPFLIPAPRHFFAKRHKKLFIRETFRSFPIGTRYAVSLQDEYLLSDIFWGEINLNANLKWQLRGLGRFIDKRLSLYRGGGYKGRKSFFALMGVKDIERTLGENKYLKRHLLVEMMKKYLPKGRKNEFWEGLCNLIGWDGEDVKEHKLANSVYPNPELRLNGLQLRVTTGLDVGKNHIVFEVLPSRQEF